MTRQLKLGFSSQSVSIVFRTRRSTHMKLDIVAPCEEDWLSFVSFPLRDSAELKPPLTH